MDEIRFNGVTSDNEVIQDLSFTIKKKDIVAISGGVETEEISKLLGLFKSPTFGTIEILGSIVNANTSKKELLKLQNNIGYFFNNPKDFLKNKTVQKEIEFGLRYLKFDNIHERCLKYLNLVELDSTYLLRNPKALSFTEQRKVMLASILAIEPQLLIFNNVDKNLTYQDQLLVKRIIKDIFKKGKQIIIITNNSSFYIDIATRIIILNDNKIIKDGKTDIFYDDDISKYVDVPPLISFIKKSNIKIKNKLCDTLDIKDLMKDIYRIKTSAERITKP